MGFPTYFHRVAACGGLSTLPKNEYSSAAVEMSNGGLVPGLIEGKLHHDRTRNGTRGTSIDGIQRHKVRAVK